VDYQKIYDQLIGRAIHRLSISGYKETHHIVPKSMGGTDDQHNLVDLTAREHFIAHNCLARIYGGREWYAVVRMAKQCQVTNSRLFEIARIKRSEEHKKGGWKHTDAERQSKSIRQTGKKASPERGVNISAAKKGKPLSEKNRLALRGKRGTWTDARRQAHKSIAMPLSQSIKISQALKGRKKSPEHILAAAQGRKRSTFNRKCIELNALIDSVFNPKSL
jgi:hypothetical protein